MSSFLVAKAHIDLLITAGLRLADDAPLTWKADPDVQGPMTLNPATADTLGSVLWSQNLASVRHTYGNDTHDGHDSDHSLDSAAGGGMDVSLPGPRGFQDEQVLTYRFERIGGPLDAVVVLKAIHAFEYQASDHPDWPSSVAHRFCRALTARLIDALPGYEQAPWSFSDREYFYRAALDVAASDAPASDVPASDVPALDVPATVVSALGLPATDQTEGSSQRIDVTASNGVPFRVIRHAPGEPRSGGGRLDLPAITIRDLRHTGPGFGPDGQFVAAYHLADIAGLRGAGLNLYGGEPSWRWDADTVARILDWLDL